MTGSAKAGSTLKDRLQTTENRPSDQYIDSWPLGRFRVGHVQAIFTKTLFEGEESTLSGLSSGIVTMKPGRY